MISSPGGLSSFLSTSNYILYLLAYLESKSPALSKHTQTLLIFLRQSQSLKAEPTVLVAGDVGVPPIAALGGLLSRARTTLRLVGLLPLYAWLRSLLAGQKPDADPVLHRIALLQCLSYIAYQALENVSVLADNGVLSKRFVALINKGDPTTGRLYLWAYRAWLAGVSCDFLRLAREAVKEKEKRAGWARTEEDKKADERWWNDFIVAAAWFPMAYHYSSTTGIPGWNLGWMGLSGLIAGSSRIQGLWTATLHP